MKKTLKEQIRELTIISIILLLIGTLTTFLLTKMIITKTPNKADPSIAPKNCAIIYPINSFPFILPDNNIPNDTAGLT